MPIAVSWRDWQERAGPEPEGQRGKQVPSGQGREMRFLGREEQKWGARQDCGCWHRLLSVCPEVSFKTSQTHHSFYLFIYPQEWTNVINDGFPHPQRARYQAHFNPAPPTVHIYFLPSWAPFFLSWENVPLFLTKKSSPVLETLATQSVVHDQQHLPHLESC